MDLKILNKIKREKSKYLAFLFKIYADCAIFFVFFIFIFIEIIIGRIIGPTENRRKKNRKHTFIFEKIKFNEKKTKQQKINYIITIINYS